MICERANKTRFASEYVAVNRLKAIQAKPRTKVIPSRVYGPCEFCGGWHLTSQLKDDIGDKMPSPPERHRSRRNTRGRR